MISNPMVRLFASVRSSFKFLPLLLALLVVAERPAKAYTDPGTGALIWQMVAAAFVGVVFYLRKFTSWFRTSRKRNPTEE
jgi:hypothetical protein